MLFVLIQHLMRSYWIVLLGGIVHFWLCLHRSNSTCTMSIIIAPKQPLVNIANNLLYHSLHHSYFQHLMVPSWGCCTNHLGFPGPITNITNELLCYSLLTPGSGLCTNPLGVPAFTMPLHLPPTSLFLFCTDSSYWKKKLCALQKYFYIFLRMITYYY